MAHRPVRRLWHDDTNDNADANFDHEFTFGGEDPPSYTIEAGMPFFRHTGVKLDSIALEFTRSGPAATTVDASAERETRAGAPCPVPGGSLAAPPRSPNFRHLGGR